MSDRSAAAKSLIATVEAIFHGGFFLTIAGVLALTFDLVRGYREAVAAIPRRYKARTRNSGRRL